MDRTPSSRARARWTYAEFARLPESGSTRYEIIDDELVVTPAPGTRHQRIATDLVTILNTFVRAHRLGELFAAPVEVLFAEGDYLEPDVVFVQRDRTHLVSDRGVEGAPDLVVEIVSRSTAGRDRGVKLERYRHFGVAEYWIVDADERRIEVWRLAEGAGAPDVLEIADTLRWQPGEESPELAVPVRETLASPGDKASDDPRRTSRSTA